MISATATEQRQQAEHERYEAYQRWERQQLADPRFASVRMLVDDLRDHDEILSDTWERFDVEEHTWAAEVADAPHSHIDRFRFELDGRNIIVKESDGLNPALTLREVYEKGLAKTRADVEAEPGLAFQLYRDELFLNFYEHIEAMMCGELAYDTIHMISTCPLPEEISDDAEEAARLLQKKYYDSKRRKSFDYTARRLPDGRLELSATTLDNSDLQAHAEVLRASGYENVSFAILQSHEYGAYLSYDNTTHHAIETVIAARVSVYDAALERQTGRKHRNGRIETENDIDAHMFFETYCDEYWAGYKAYHELLAKHAAKGGRASQELRDYLLSCLEKQERVDKSVLDAEALFRLRMQLRHGVITKDMVMSCRELLVYDHHATLGNLLKQFRETGQVERLAFTDDKSLLGAYAEAASGYGAEAAANGETFAGCETATTVTSLATAAQAAVESNMSLEGALRQQQKEARHCLEIKLLGYTIRENVTCPFCNKQVNARDTQKTIECLGDDCRTVLDKASGAVTTREQLLETSGSKKEAVKSRIKLQSNHMYELGEQSYRRELHTVVGGVKLVYIDASGQQYIGVAAEQIEAAILNHLESASQAA